MAHVFRGGELKFSKVSEHRYACEEFEILKVYGYYFAFKNKLLLNSNGFSRQAAYNACLQERRNGGKPHEPLPRS